MLKAMTPKIHIKLDDRTDKAVKRLLETHLKNASEHSPEEAIFALDIDALKVPEISFWTAWQASDILGCGALKILASQLLSHILEQAKFKNIRRISLETGTAEAYIPAHRLYKKHGFKQCGAFADYQESEHSLYMSKLLY